MSFLKAACAVIAASLGLCASPANAQLSFTRACVSASGANANQQLCELDAAGVTSLAGTEIGPGALALGSAAASSLAQFGTLRASTSATERLFAVTGTSSSANATANASFTDSLVVNSPGLAGLPGFVDFRVDYSWRFSNGLAGSNGQLNNAEMSIQFGQEFAFAREQYRQGALPGTVESVLTPLAGSSGITVVDARLGSFFVVRMPVVFGRSTSLQQSLVLTSTATFAATASIDSFNSAYWGGMVVRDKGLAVVPFSATSASGTDYTVSYAPIPEPGTALLAALGLVALGARQRLRHGR